MHPTIKQTLKIHVSTILYKDSYGLPDPAPLGSRWFCCMAEASPTECICI